MDFKVGDKFRAVISNSTVKIHVVAIVDGNKVVYKWYGKHKQWWHYHVIGSDDLKWRKDLAVERDNELQEQQEQ